MFELTGIDVWIIAGLGVLIVVGLVALWLAGGEK